MSASGRMLSISLRGRFRNNGSGPHHVYIAEAKEDMARSKHADRLPASDGADASASSELPTITKQELGPEFR